MSDNLLPIFNTQGCGPIWFDELDIESDSPMALPFGDHVADSVFVQRRGEYIDIIDTDCGSPRECNVVTMTVEAFRKLKGVAIHDISEMED